MSFKEAIKVCFKKYFKISGRATRAEYWWFQLFGLLVIFIPMMLGLLFNGGEVGEVFSVFVAIACLLYAFIVIPLFCVKIRRYHDAGYSGFFIFVNLIPYVGSLIDFILLLLKSTPDNEWGPNPFNEQKEIIVESEVVVKQNDKKRNKEVTDIEL